MERIVSTANVPPQRADWFWEIVRSQGAFRRLPKDILEIIGEYVKYPMSRAESDKFREDLMNERKFFTKEHTEEVYEREFSLCEH